MKQVSRLNLAWVNTEDGGVGDFWLVGGKDGEVRLASMWIVRGELVYRDLRG